VGLFAILFVAPSATSAQGPVTVPVTTTTPTSTSTTTTNKHPGGHGHHPKHKLLPRMLAVGDSVMKGCSTPTSYSPGGALQDALENRVHVDAEESRQIRDTIAVINSYRARGRLPRIVIIQVGNNGPLYFNPDLIDLKHALRGVPDVIVVNVRNGTSWQDESNEAIRTWLHGWSAAHLADWYDASTDAMTYDHTHPKPQYCPIYGRVIARAVRATHPRQYAKK
jgi:hypothetical protein